MQPALLEVGENI